MKLSEYVSVDWNVANGEIVIAGRLVTTRRIITEFRRYSVDWICTVYNLDRRQVEDAIRFELQLCKSRRGRPKAVKPETSEAGQSPVLIRPRAGTRAGPPRNN